MKSEYGTEEIYVPIVLNKQLAITLIGKADLTVA